MKLSIQIAILLSLLLILVTQAAYLAIPLTIILSTSLLLLAYCFKKQKVVPKILTFILVLMAIIAIYVSYKSFIGVDAGVAVLTTFMFAKALESKDKRDFVVLFNFALFVAASSFLFSQNIWMAIAIIMCLMSCMLGLYRIQLGEFEQYIKYQYSPRKAIVQDLKHVGRLLLLATPFFILLFMFFPRLPPLWHIPIPENKAVTGISDTMSPGDIASLSQSTALAFRIVGDVKKLPTPSELYWRALVLDQYDGNQWTSSLPSQQPRSTVSVQTSQSFDYQYIASDPSIIWVMGLEKSIPLEPRYYNRQDWGIEPRRLTQRIEPIQLRWLGSQPQLDKDIPDYIYRINTKFQTNYDQRAQKLADQLYEQSEHNSEHYVQNILDWYRTNGFVYTLSPGVLGEHRIDDFLFSSKQGFCEHYASSFVMLMRYVGIPARVVAGYQGGQLAPDGKSWEVRQMDAHAWAEVLINDVWVRVDPTSVISAQRIEDGMQNLIEQDSGVLGEKAIWSAHRFQTLKKMRIWGDYVSYQWKSKVVGYTAESQRNWLTKLGIGSSYSAILVIVIGVLSLLLLYWLFNLSRKYASESELDRAMVKMNRALPYEFKHLSHETIHQWLLRLSSEVDNEHRSKFDELIKLYDQTKYSAYLYTANNVNKIKVLTKYCTHALKNK